MSYVARISIDGGSPVPVGSSLYGTCETLADVAAKVVSCPDFDQLIVGVTIWVKFTNTNTAENPTMNVNSTGDLPIYQDENTHVGVDESSSWTAGSVLAFTYDGTAWFINCASGTSASAPIISYNDLTDKPSIPTKTSDLANDSGFLTEHQNISGKADRMNTVLDTTLSCGRKESTDVGDYSFAFGYEVTASGYCAHAEGGQTTVSGDFAHAEGANTNASSRYSHAEGSQTTASATAAHAEGNITSATAFGSHAEGMSTAASGQGSHAEGGATTASGQYSHAEGYYSTASGQYSHASGHNTIADTKGLSAHGSYNVAATPAAGSDIEAWIPGKSYVAGAIVKNSGNVYGCKTPNSDSVWNSSKWYNLSDGAEAFIIGNGASDTVRHNAFSVQWDGKVKAAGDFYAAGNKLATESFVNQVFAANDAMVFKGTLGAGGTVTALPDTHEVGWTYKVATAGTYAGQACEVGDMIICVTDGTQASGLDWAVIQSNIDSNIIDEKVDKNLGAINSGKLLYVDSSGLITPISLTVDPTTETLQFI